MHKIHSYILNHTGRRKPPSLSGRAVLGTLTLGIWQIPIVFNIADVRLLHLSEVFTALPFLFLRIPKGETEAYFFFSTC